MMIDYHTHHARCGHAEGELEDYIKRGIALGLSELGLSDHMPLLHLDPAAYYPGMAMAADELPRYVEECLELKRKYRGQIDIRVGLEGDYVEGWEEQIERIVNGYPWDYVIGSVHFLGDWDISDHRQLHNWEGKRVEDVYRRYYDAVCKAARTGFYDFIGHIDVIKRFGYKPETDMAEEERRALEIVRGQDLAIELNASGLRMPAEEMFPGERLLAYAIEQGIPITIGSDAHQPARLGQYLDRAKALLWNLGVRELATFEGRRRVMKPLSKPVELF